MKRLLMITVGSLLLAGGALAQTTIGVNGSTTVLPIMQKMVETYMAANPTVKITVSGGGSGNGIKAIIDGSTTLAMSSREMKDGEVAQAKGKGVAANPIAIAVDAIVPIVNPENPVKGLSRAQLRDIFNGKITN